MDHLSSDDEEVTATRDTVAAFIKASRLAAGLRQQDVADTVGIDIAQVSRWERGVTLPHPRRAKSLAATLRVDPTELATMIALAASEESKSLRRERDLVLDKLDELTAKMDALTELVDAAVTVRENGSRPAPAAPRTRQR